MKQTSIMYGITAVCEWIMRFSVINILWIIFNFPISWLVLNLIFANDWSSLIIFFILIVLLAPIVFFPATQAMFAVVREWILGHESNSLIKSYWHHYKKNYRKSTIAGFIMTTLWLGLLTNIVYFSQSNALLMFLLIFLGVVLFVFTVNFFSVMAHYQLGIKDLMKNTFAITFGSPLLFITIIICGVLLVYICSQAWYVLTFFAGSLFAFLSFSAFYRLFLKLLKGKQQ